MFNVVMFAIGLATVFAITTLSMMKFIKPGFEFWPPPSPNSWQHHTFRSLFRTFFASLLVISVSDFHTGSTWRYVLGGSLLVIGFGFALRWTGFLGWRDAFGEAPVLKTEGPFAWSRNPIYMASIVGMIGWALTMGSWYVSVLLGLWGLLYICAPFLEEPWLEQEFGEAFRDYRRRVPRYLGIPR